MLSLLFSRILFKVCEALSWNTSDFPWAWQLCKCCAPPWCVPLRTHWAPPQSRLERNSPAPIHQFINTLPSITVHVVYSSKPCLSTSAPELSSLLNTLGHPSHLHHNPNPTLLPALIYRQTTTLGGKQAELPYTFFSKWKIYTPRSVGRAHQEHTLAHFVSPTFKELLCFSHYDLQLVLEKQE